MFPEVSVVMSVYNAEDYLKESIDSILNQTFPNFEFIIVDDGSTDRSLEIIKSYKDSRIRLLKQNNTGLAIALNNAIKISDSPFIARMDSDDIALAVRLEKQVRFLKENEDYLLVGANVLVIDKDGEFVYQSSLPLSWEEIQTKFPDSSFFHSSVIFRRGPFDRCGGYFEEISKFNCFEDSILWNQMKRYGKMANIDTPLLKYRLRPSASTQKSGRKAIKTNAVFKEIIRDGYLSDKNHEILLKNKSTAKKTDQLFTYHVHLAKKYLFNNQSSLKSRSHITEALKINPFKIFPYCFFIISFLPIGFLRWIYKQKES
jgi:glycosyltransferase involved in cell wall biosynthesis